MPVVVENASGMKPAAEVWPVRFASEHEGYGEACKIAKRGKWDPKWLRLWVDVLAVLEHGCWFDEDKGAHAADFFPTFLSLWKGDCAGKPFELMDWARDDLVIPLYGWQRPACEECVRITRRYRRFYCEVGKKNAKSTLVAGMGLMELLQDGGPEVYFGAVDKNQSGICYENAKNMGEASGVLSKRLKFVPSRNRILYPAGLGILRALSSEISSQDGQDSTFVILDELKDHRKRGMYDTWKYSGDARDQPIFGVITTAGEYVATSIGWEEHEAASKVRAGIIEDWEYLSLIYACTEEAFEAALSAMYPSEEGVAPDEGPMRDCIRSANPALGVTVKMKDVLSQVRDAKERPGQMPALKHKKFNIWAGAKNRLVDMGKWNLCGAAPGVEEGEASSGTFSVFDGTEFERLPEWLKGRPCFPSLDLSSSIDLSSLGLTFPPWGADPRYVYLPRYYMPEGNVTTRVQADNVPYDVWRSQKLIQCTDGKVIDTAVIVNDVLKMRELGYDIKELPMDPSWGREAMTGLIDEGFEVVEFYNTCGNFNAAVGKFEALLVSGPTAFYHGGDSVTKWMASNLTVRTDDQGRRRPERRGPDGQRDDKKKIDGMATWLMGLARAIAWVEENAFVWTGI